jgi:hypothetical protein
MSDLDIDAAFMRCSLPVKKRDWLLVLILLSVSYNPGLPLVFGGMETLLLSTVGLLTICMLLTPWHRLCSIALWPFFVFGFLILAQAKMFCFLPLLTIVGFFCRMFIGYAVICLVHDFPLKFVKVMTSLALLSLFFWMMTLSGILSPFTQILRSFALRTTGYKAPILVHTFFFSSPTTLGFRNSGIFWEPGAFAGYLVLAIMFVGFLPLSMTVKARRWSLCVLSLTVLTTMSTTGYIALPLGWLLQWIGGKKSSFRVFVFPLLISSIFFGYSLFELDFVGKKIFEQYETAVDQRGDQWYLTRFGTMVFDWEYIRRRPLSGWGLHDDTRYMLHDKSKLRLAMGNGLSSFTAQFGFVGIGTCLLFIWLGFYWMSGRRLMLSGIATLVIVVLLNGEGFLGHPAFLSLMFLPGRYGRLARGDVEAKLPGRRGCA